MYEYLLTPRGIISLIFGVLLAYLAIRLLLGSFVYIPNTHYGILERQWAFKPSDEPFGLIALSSGAGFVPEVLRGGWHLLMPFQYHVHRRPLIRIDQMAYLVARVGAPLAEGQALAAWPAGVSVEDARGFLENGGQAGMQRHFLRPKTYAINTALFCVISESNIYNIDDSASEDDTEWQTVLKKREGFQPIIIDNDNIGIITVQDGPSLAHGEIIAPTVGADSTNLTTFHNSFQDISKFLAAGGRRGRQEQVLVEGTYFINRMFATVEVKPKTKVGIGTVGVVNSYVGPEVTDSLTADQGRGRTVERGKRGIWEKPLEPGMYAINPYGAEVTHVPTTNFQLRWEDGVKSTLSDARAVSNRVSFDDDLAEVPVITKDAFEILLPISVVAHIKPANAPYVIQRFSQVSRFVNQTLDPLVSSYFRDAAQEKDLLDFIKGRAEIAKAALEMMRTRLAEHRIDIEEVLLGTPREEAGRQNVERLLDQLRQAQMAGEQEKTYKAQVKAAEAKKDLNEKLAIADQQTALTASNISIQVAQNQGQAEAARKVKEAEGIKVTADAEAHAIKARGEAQAHASKVTSEAVGGSEYLLKQFLTTKLTEAIVGSKYKLVPDTVVGGSGTGGSSLIETLLAMTVSQGGLPGHKEPEAPKL